MTANKILMKGVLKRQSTNKEQIENLKKENLDKL